MTDLTAVLEVLEATVPRPPEVLLVLGSGLSTVVDRIRRPLEIPFERLPGFPRKGVPGHPGRLVFGELAGKATLVQVGRFHLYEGHSPALVTAPVRLAAALGAEVAVLTNSSGSMATGLEPGRVALISGYLDFQRRRDATSVGAGRAAFDPGLQSLARGAAAELGIALVPVVYAAVLGPSYETPAEIRMLRAAGADLVGMSTVPEACAACEEGVRVLGLSLVSNRASGLSGEALTHEAVLRAGEEGAEILARLISAVLARLP